MNLKDAKWREDAVSVMKKILSSNQYRLANQLDDWLSAAEKSVHKFVRDLSFQEGAWYRPGHNLTVPAAMLAISQEEKFSRDLIYPALLHDSGYSLMKMAETTKGADWGNPDKRYQHMHLGSIMTYSVLLHLRSQGVDLGQKRIGELAAIVATHDYPYLGLKLTTQEELAHRDADRIFVPSALSWYKDLVAHASDDKYLQKAKDWGIEICPEQFLLCRLAYFYSSKEDLPTGWDPQTYPLCPELAAYNEGGKVEAPYTQTAKSIINEMFKQRALELETARDCSIPKFGQLFENTFVPEIENLIARIQK